MVRSTFYIWTTAHYCLCQGHPVIDSYNPRLDGSKFQVVVETHDIR